MSRKRRNDDETVECIWGINSKTLEVERIFVTRGGLMTRYGKDMQSYSHQIEHGRAARAEAVIVFDLTDLKSVAAASIGTEYEQRVKAELEAKAAKVKAGEEKF